MNRREISYRENSTEGLRQEALYCVRFLSLTGRKADPANRPLKKKPIISLLIPLSMKLKLLFFLLGWAPAVCIAQALFDRVFISEGNLPYPTFVGDQGGSSEITPIAMGKTCGITEDRATGPLAAQKGGIRFPGSSNDPVLCAWPIGQTEKQPSLAYLFTPGEGGYDTFRIPALAVTCEGAVLAFAEGRKNSASDTGDIDLVLKRSDDNGKTWGPLQRVWDDAENTCGNPSPVVDRETGTIFLLASHNLGSDREPDIIDQTSRDTRRVFVLRSDDEGRTWSAPEEITKEVKKENWTWYATGPCQGIQITRGKYKGRLVVPADHIEAQSQKYYSHVIYSDDHGKSWKLGGRTPSDQVNECAVAELEGGRLLLNMRNYDRKFPCRKIAVSENGGVTWSEPSADSTLVEPICQGSLHRYSFASEGKSRLLFANPASADARENMTLRISYDDGRSWGYAHVLYPGASAYSDVVRLPDDLIGCLYEAGRVHPYEGIVFERIHLSELEK